MTIAVTRTVRVQPGGIVELRLPEFQVGEIVEVIVLLESQEDRSSRSARVRALVDMFRELRSQPQIQSLTHDEIAQEIAAFRRGHD